MLFVPLRLTMELSVLVCSVIQNLGDAIIFPKSNTYNTTTLSLNTWALFINVNLFKTKPVKVR